MFAFTSPCAPNFDHAHGLLHNQEMKSIQWCIHEVTGPGHITGLLVAVAESKALLAPVSEQIPNSPVDDETRGSLKERRPPVQVATPLSSVGPLWGFSARKVDVN